MVPKILVKFLHGYAFWPVEFSECKPNICADVMLGVDKELRDKETQWVASIKTNIECSKVSPLCKIDVGSKILYMPM